MKNRIKELRLKHNLTLRRLGKELDMYDSRISQYETGKRQPNIETWQKLADYFNVSVPYLQGYAEINDSVVEAKYCGEKWIFPLTSIMGIEELKDEK